MYTHMHQGLREEGGGGGGGGGGSYQVCRSRSDPALMCECVTRAWH